MFYRDLSHESDVEHGSHVRAVGWLSKDHPYAIGHVSGQFLTSLHWHICTAWQPRRKSGIHLCAFCPQPLPNGRYIGGNTNVWIPTRDRIYVAPELILHYIRAHGYNPPTEFAIAVLACPEQGSPEYLRLMDRFRSKRRRCHSAAMRAFA